MSVVSRIKKLGKQLYPTGRAFRVILNTEKLNNALAASEARAYADAVSILDSALPDNDNFTAEDATQWERRLGIISNEDVSLEDRKLAIIRKIRHPGNIPARQHYLYLQGQLRAAGFDVYVHENIFDTYPDGRETKTPFEFAALGDDDFIAEHGNFQHGELQHGQIGEYGMTLVANNLDEEEDQDFDVGSNYRSTFFVGGEEEGTFADVDEDRRSEFRQLILRIKPVQTVGYLLINYV